MHAKVISFDMGCRNLCVCLTSHSTDPDLETDRTANRIHHWEVVDILRSNGVTAKSVSIETMTKCTVAFLNRHATTFDDFKPTLVAIEQQPAMGRCPNVRMKVMSHVVQAWFFQRDPSLHIMFCNPKRKLKSLSAGGGEGACKKRKRSTYRANKKWAVEEARRQLIENREDPTWLSYFDELPKKDDAADAYLQALWSVVEHVRKRRKRHKVAV